ncbi:MAG: hypothetical protein ACKVW3_01700 [Phycisphaerales bacterium]
MDDQSNTSKAVAERMRELANAERSLVDGVMHLFRFGEASGHGFNPGSIGVKNLVERVKEARKAVSERYVVIENETHAMRFTIRDTFPMTHVAFLNDRPLADMLCSAYNSRWYKERMEA